MSQQKHTEPELDTHYTFRLRRRSLAEWCAWLIWLIALCLLAEYAITSMYKDERQATIVASVIALGLLLAGIIVEVMKTIDLESKHKHFPQAESDNDETE